MRNPKPKARNKLSPALLELSESIREREGEFFNEPKPCPVCGSEEFGKHDIVDRLFCKLIVDGGFEDVWVKVRRFYCKKCGKIFPAGPFYPDCVYSSPVVDLCLYLAASNPSNRVERILIDFGVQVDRDTVRRYTQLFEEKLEEFAGIKLMGESLGVNFVKALFECGTIEELKEEHEGEFFESCHDETYPSKKGAKKQMKEENTERKAEGKKKIPYPEAFCAAFSYVPSHGFYASSVIRDFDFNSLLAKILLAPTEGADWRITDRNPSYGEFKTWKCLFHLFKSKTKDDETLKLLKEELPHLVPNYLSKRYEEFRREKLKELRGERPDLFEGGEFKGSLTTNAMEGGNWRLKYELRTPYSSVGSISGRMNLIAFLESLRTFKNGKPSKSWAHQHSNFELKDVMSIEIEESKIQTHTTPPERREKSTIGGVQEPNQNLLNPPRMVEA